MFAIVVIVFVACNKGNTTAPATSSNTNSLVRDFLYFPVKDAKWQYMYKGTWHYTDSLGYHYDDDFHYITTIVAANKDTIAIGKRYYIYDVFHQTIHPQSKYNEQTTERYFLREDTINSKVYRYLGDTSEIIAFNFAAKIGDEIPNTGRVTKIDSILIASCYVKRWILNGGGGDFFGFGYGIGGRTGVYYGTAYYGNGSKFMGLHFYYKGDSVTIN